MRGFGSEAVSAAIRRVLIDLRLNRLEAVIDPDNRASIRFVESLRMKREKLRRNYYFQNNRWEDQVAYTISRKDLRWPPLMLKELK